MRQKTERHQGAADRTIKDIRVWLDFCFYPKPDIWKRPFRPTLTLNLERR